MDYLAAMHAFVRSVDLGSFSKAAAERGLKVSTVSRYVSGLEADLGVALLNRSTHSLNPTEAGRQFYERAAQILADFEDARNATASLNDRPQGLLRINLPLVFGRLHVMAHMKEFLASYPDIKIDATLTEDTVDLIEAGSDVAVRIGALVDSRLIARKLAPLKRVLVAAPAYLAERPALVDCADLARHECLQFTLQPGSAWYCNHKSQPDHERAEVPVSGRVRANNLETLNDAALAGLGIALLPTWLVHHDISEARLASVLPQYEWFISPGAERAIWAVYPPKKVVSPKVKAFIAFLVQRFGEPPYWDRP